MCSKVVNVGISLKREKEIFFFISVQTGKDVGGGRPGPPGGDMGGRVGYG